MKLQNQIAITVTCGIFYDDTMPAITERLRMLHKKRRDLQAGLSLSLVNDQFCFSM